MYMRLRIRYILITCLNIHCTCETQFIQLSYLFFYRERNKQADQIVHWWLLVHQEEQQQHLHGTNETDGWNLCQNNVYSFKLLLVKAGLK